MPRNTNTDLQNHLFEVIEKLSVGDIELDKAKAISEVAKQIIEAKKLDHQGNELKLQSFKLIAEYNGKVDESKLLGG